MRLTLYGYFFALSIPILSFVFSQPALAETPALKIGIVVMHGKGGAPSKIVADLASGLAQQGYLVSNLDMPWSGHRQYDVPVSVAESEVETALSGLRKQGAQKVFVAGHSQGGVFALYFGTKHTVDGIIAIAPGGSSNSMIFREKLGPSVDKARKLIADDQGEVRVSLTDFEGSKGSFPVITTPLAYLSWFDPEGAMNQTKSVQNMNPTTPVLFIAPSNDYPGLLKMKQKMFDALPKPTGTKLYEPNSSHLDAPTASTQEIITWTSSIATAH